MPPRPQTIPFRCPTPGCGSQQYEAVVVKRPSGPEYQTPFYSCHRCSVMFRDPEAFSNLREKAGAPTMDQSIFRGRSSSEEV